MTRIYQGGMAALATTGLLLALALVGCEQTATVVYRPPPALPTDFPPRTGAVDTSGLQQVQYRYDSPSLTYPAGSGGTVVDRLVYQPPPKVGELPKVGDTPKTGEAPKTGELPRPTPEPKGTETDRGTGVPPLPPTALPTPAPAAEPVPGPIPYEMEMVFPPCYIIEPPDVLLIDALRLTPRGPYRIEALDVLFIQANPTLPEFPINGQFQVTLDGVVNIGTRYGPVVVRGLTLEQAAEAIKRAVAKYAPNPQVSLSLVSFRGLQQIRGEHLVAQDGTINLGAYGCVNVVGLSLKQAKYVIERHLSQALLDPEVSVQVAAYNSKVYYVVLDGGGFGMQIARIPITGKETVLDALSAVGGLPSVSSTKRLWLARPAPAGKGCFQVLPIDLRAIVEGGQTATNYQIFPGDRVYIAADPYITADNTLAKIFAPVERIFGIVLLGNATVQSFRNNNNNNNGTTFFGGF